MAVDRGEPQFLRTLFRALDDHEVRYCVLNSWEKPPEQLPSDLDLAVHPRDRAKLAAVLGTLRDRGFLPVQCLNYAVNAYGFVFYWFQSLALQSIAVDVIFEHCLGGLNLMTGEKLVAGRLRHKSFWIPDPAVELHYLLASRTWKGSIPPQQQERLKRLVEEIGRLKAEKVAADLYGEKRKKRVVDACLNGTISTISKQLRGPLRRTLVLRHPLSPVRYFFSDFIRLIRRLLQPTGIFVVILGPDGVGKSTLVGQLIENLGPTFRGHGVFHFRPNLIKPAPEAGLVVTDPHRNPVRGTFGSVMRLAGLFADFWAGHLLVTRPLLTRSGLVIFDRYFHDIMIDNRRYRYGGPLWLVRILARFVPPPDLLFLVLDAEVGVILSRKREVAPEELNRLRSSYINLTLETSRAGLIKTDESIAQSTAAATHIVAHHMAERFNQRLGSWLMCDRTAGDGKPVEVNQH